jgi:hypothetical protein
MTHITIERAKLEQVLGALELVRYPSNPPVEAALAVCKHALAAQPVQEPVAYAVYHRMGGGKSLHWPEQHSENGDANEYKLFPLHTTLPAAQPASVQEPIYQMQMMDGKWIDQAKQSYEYNKAHGNTVRIVYTTPPAQPAVPDAMTSADIQEHIEYVAGWNECRQAMLEMMK